MKRLVVAFACAVGLTTAACDSSTAGTPTAQPSSPPATSVPSVSTTPAPTTSGLSPRPRDIDLTGVDPCKLLTDQQLHELVYDLGYQRAPEPSMSTVYGGPVCTFASSSPPDQPSRHITTGLGISTSEGIDAWLTDPARKSLTADAKRETVAGFPALTFTVVDKTTGDDCSVELDVHDGQYLDVQSSSELGRKPEDPEFYCTEAKRVAGLAIQNIESQK